ncbi:MarC family protein [Lishizhenia sp.]|uniref:MarC family protein n=1 Tax=Lishizhenia sp. TaxID=2497594 RepID=UPI00299DE663|nr:MarC family protein [Lishizhenia sp.]MDX1445189.1 MarC family protein [Lishizhenia sp.]
MIDFFLEFSFNGFLKAFMVLFAVIDIVGSIPLIIKIKEKNEVNPIKASLVSLGIMLAFLIVGEGILGVFGVGVRSFAVAGSLILFAMAVEMIMGIELFKDDGHGGRMASIVPLAFPIIAGAGSMTTIISLQAEYSFINIALAIIVNILLVYIVLVLTKRIEKLLGPGGIAILKKVFGIILLAIAIKLFATNIPALFENLHGAH